MSSTSLRSSLRSIALVAVGAVLGATFVAPVTLGARDGASPAATSYTRTASCPGLGFMPRTSDDSFNGIGLLRTGFGFMICPIALPNGAVVKRVRFTLSDYGAKEVSDCALVRASLGATASDSANVLARVPTSSDVPQARQRLTTTAITHATVNNASFAYYLQCYLSGPSQITGILGADVQYTVSAANG